MVAVPNLLRGFLTAPQAAEALSVSTATLKRWRAQGSGPRSVRLGAKLYYRQHDLEAWVEAEASRDEPR